MKTTIREMDYAQAAARPRPEHQHPCKPAMFWRGLLRLLTIPGLAGTQFHYDMDDRAKQALEEPCLVLMNHSCFLDMEIAHRILFPRPFNIITTSDAFVGMGGLMNWALRQIGCFPTQKFVTDLRSIQDMEYCFHTLGSNVLMYPEASYSFDGTATPLPRKMGVLLKKFDVPVVMIETFGAFSRNPLYNELQVRRDVRVSATVRCLFTRQEIRENTVQTLSDGLDEAFSFDHFKWQKEQGVQIRDEFRADGLNRILYKCAHCGAEGKMEGRGTGLTCHHCGKHYELTPLGELEADDGVTEFSHIPDWYAWERSSVRQEILEGTYKLDVDVDIAMLVDYDSIYMVGQGHLTHDRNGFDLTGCDGRLHYTQKPVACYGLYADYYWYEIADTICIGDKETLYYCFPRGGGDVVAKTRLAVEELYKLSKHRRHKLEASTENPAAKHS